MTVQYKDRISDTTTTVGTGTLTLLGVAPAGFRTFAAAGFTTRATVRYCITSNDLANWEVGEGVWTSAGSTLTRATVFASSNAGALVNFPSGTHEVSVVMTAADATSHKVAVYLNAATNTTTAGWQKVSMDTVSYDTGGIWDATNKRVQPTLKGYYLATVRARTTTTGTLVAGIYKNGVLEHALGMDNSVASSAAGGTALVYCNGTSDYIEPWVFTTTVRAFNVGSAVDTYFHVHGPV